MRKHIIFAFIMAAALFLSGTNIMADDDPTHESSAESTVTIEFAEGDANIDPLDPDNPVIPENGGGTGGGSSLALNYVSSFNFAPQIISASKEEYPTANQKPYIQVTDLRGTGAGWEVYAKASKFQDEYGQFTLKGSSIDFADTSLKTTTTEVTPPTPVSEFSLPADSSTLVRVVEAKQLTGMGTWLVRWYTSQAPTPNESVMLSVPGGSGMLGQNTSVITWYLTLGPIT